MHQPSCLKEPRLEAGALCTGRWWCILESEVHPPLKRTIQVRISKGDHQFVAECLDLPVVTQAATLDELAANIREAIGLHLEGEDLADLGFASNPTILATMELEAVA